MSNLVPQQEFQDRLKERIRESIGELLTDEELKSIIERSMEEIFFKPVIEKENFGRKEYSPPFVQVLIKELLEERVRLSVKEYLSQNRNVIGAMVKDVVQQGIGIALLNSLNAMFRGEMMDLENGIVQKLRDGIGGM